MEVIIRKQRSQWNSIPKSSGSMRSVNHLSIHGSYNQEIEESMEFHSLINWINDISELSLDHGNYNNKAEESMEFHS